MYIGYKVDTPDCYWTQKRPPRLVRGQIPKTSVLVNLLQEQTHLQRIVAPRPQHPLRNTERRLLMTHKEQRFHLKQRDQKEHANRRHQGPILPGVSKCNSLTRLRMLFPSLLLLTQSQQQKYRGKPTVTVSPLITRLHDRREGGEGRGGGLRF